MTVVRTVSDQHGPDTGDGWRNELYAGARIARALVQQPEVLLLDEPTNHLDVAHQLELLDLVCSLELATVAALRDLNLAAAFCDEIVVLAKGRVVAAGPPFEVLTAELIGSVYKSRRWLPNIP